MRAQHPDGGVVEGDGASTGFALGDAGDGLAAQFGALLGDVDLSGVEVDVGPAQSEGSAAAQAAEGVGILQVPGSM